jgi:hypothetical protein
MLVVFSENFSNFSLCSWNLPWHIVTVVWLSYFTHEMAICHNPYYLSNWDSRITGQLSCRHTFCQNVVSTKNWVSSYFLKNITCLSVGLLRIYQVSFCLLWNCVLVGYNELLFCKQFTFRFGVCHVILTDCRKLKKKVFDDFRGTLSDLTSIPRFEKPVQLFQNLKRHTHYNGHKLDAVSEIWRLYCLLIQGIIYEGGFTFNIYVPFLYQFLLKVVFYIDILFWVQHLVNS